MSWVAAAIVGGAAVGAIGSSIAAGEQASATESAANKQLQSTQEGQQLLREMYAKNAPYWTPYTNLGEKGVTNITSMLPYLTEQYPTYKSATMADIKAMMPAEYEFMKNQGLGAVRQSMNVGGGGSNVTRSATKFAEDYATQAYQTALNNYMQQQSLGFNQAQTQRSNIYNTLSNIAGLGQQGAAGLSNLGAGVATNIANLGVQGATAIGAGQIGSANAIASGIQGVTGNIANAGMLYGMLNKPSSQQLTSTQYPTTLPEGNYNYSLQGGFTAA
jgi:hypothetical protein